MKVLFIGYYRENSGWGHATRNWILALDKVGVDIVPRCVRISNDDPQLPQRIIELEKKDTKNCDIVIQKLLPHHMCYDGHFYKNISAFLLESSNCKYSSWPSYINMMDEVWVPCPDNKRACLNSNIYKPIHIIPETYDDTKFELGYEPLDIPFLRNKFVFYFIGENTRRKNLAALIQAFHLEFSPAEPVELLIKSRTPGVPNEQQSQYLHGNIQEIKKNLKIYQNLNAYKKECIITDHISDVDIMKIHATAHCLVMPSCSEGWNIPISEAMAFGNPVIANNCGGMQYQIKNVEGGLLVKNHKVPCIGALDTLPDLYTSRETWHAIDVADLRIKMRNVYEDKELRNKLSKNGVCNSRIFNYENVGRMMKERFEA
jgi:glycosyltransferase involved in cell wall biosynthesis